MFTELARHPNIGLRYAAVTTTNSDSSIRLPVAFVTVELWRTNFGDRQRARLFVIWDDSRRIGSVCSGLSEARQCLR